MMILTLLALAAATPSVEAEALGLRLARTGVLATIAPMLMAKDTEELVTEHPELTEAERTTLRALSKRTAEATIARLNAAFGHAYAERLSVEELKQLVEAAESPAAARFRAVMPETMVAAMTGLETVDFKQELRDAFCRDDGKLCRKAKRLATRGRSPRRLPTSTSSATSTMRCGCSGFRTLRSRTGRVFGRLRELPAAPTA